MIDLIYVAVIQSLVYPNLLLSQDIIAYSIAQLLISTSTCLYNSTSYEFIGALYLWLLTLPYRMHNGFNL